MNKKAKKPRISALDRRIGENLQKLRLYKNLSQEKLATVLDVSFQQVQKYENGTNRLSAAKIYTLHQYFNVPLDYFFAGIKGPKEGEMALLDADPLVLTIFHKLRSFKNENLLRKISQIIDILGS